MNHRLKQDSAVGTSYYLNQTALGSINLMILYKFLSIRAKTRSVVKRRESIDTGKLGTFFLFGQKKSIKIETELIVLTSLATDIVYRPMIWCLIC